MLVHLPFVILAALAPTPVAATATADGIPKLDMVGECNFEADTQANRQHCVDDEKQALQQLQKEWQQFHADDRRQCRGEATMGGAGSYAELLTCLEMARDTRNDKERAQKTKP